LPHRQPQCEDHAHAGDGKMAALAHNGLPEDARATHYPTSRPGVEGLDLVFTRGRIAETAMTDRRRSGGGKSDAEQQRHAAAQALAVAALSFIAAEPERLARFLAVTGLTPQSIRAAAMEPDFLAGVLDHVTGDERLLLAFAAESERDPDEVM